MERPHFDIVASGARMRAIRQERKISVKQVMEYMGFESTQAVYKWEAGKCFPQADNLIALAILYRVSPMELLVEEDLVPSSSHIWGKCRIVRNGREGAQGEQYDLHNGRYPRGFHKIFREKITENRYGTDNRRLHHYLRRFWTVLGEG